MIRRKILSSRNELFSTMVAREDNATHWLDLTSPGHFLEEINVLETPWVQRLSTRSNQDVWSKAFQTAFPLFDYLGALQGRMSNKSWFGNIRSVLEAPESDFFKHINVPYTTDLVFDGNLAELHDKVGVNEKSAFDDMLGAWEDYDIYVFRMKNGTIYIGQKLPKIPDDPRASNAEDYKINHWWAELDTIPLRTEPNQETILYEYRLQSFGTDIMNFSVFDGWGATDVEIYRLRPRQMSTLNYPQGL